jgi:DNA replication protein DnaC
MQIAFENGEQFLTDLFAEESRIREDNRNRRRLKRAGFPPDQNAGGVLLREHLTELWFIGARESLICMVEVRTGKTHLVIALGLKTALRRKEVRFLQTVDLPGNLTRDLDSCDLLTVDEPGVSPLHCHSVERRFQVIASCYERRSVAITTNSDSGIR